MPINTVYNALIWHFEFDIFWTQLKFIWPMVNSKISFCIWFYDCQAMVKLFKLICLCCSHSKIVV